MLPSARTTAALTIVTVAACVAAAPVGAQELDPEERVAAAEAAYDRGTRAFESQDWLEAARWYERADELHPSPTALMQAIRSRRRAGEDHRAATLAAHLVAREGEEMRSRVGFLAEVAARSVRVDVTCAWCEVSVDGEETRYRTLFLAPDQDHVVAGTFSTGVREEQVRGAAGEERSLTLRPPEPRRGGTEGTGDEPGDGRVDDAGGGPAGVDGAGADDGGLPLPVVLVCGGATAILGGMTVWSGLDTNAAQAELEEDPTLERYEDGTGRASRTNILLGATIGAAVVTAGLALFTDWDGERDPSVAVAPGPDGITLAAEGRW